MAEKPIKVRTPYPAKAQALANNNMSKKLAKAKKDTEFIGDELVKLTNRLNELELSVHDMNEKLKQVTGRMGL